MPWPALVACLLLAIAMAFMTRRIIRDRRAEQRLRRYREMIDATTDDLRNDTIDEHRGEPGSNNQKHSEPRSETNE